MSWLRRCAELQQPANFESSLFMSGQLVDVFTVIAAATFAALDRLACARMVRSIVAARSRKRALLPPAVQARIESRSVLTPSHADLQI